MSGLFRRLRRAPGVPAETPATEAAGRDDPRPGHGAAEPVAEPGDAVTRPAEEPASPPAGDLDALVGSPPSSRRRGRVRRRLRHLRRVREVLMRDLGGFVFEMHRSGGGAGGAVMEEKLRRLAGVDAELRELEALLDDRRPLVVREPGIGGACPACGELFASEARYCWACGTEVAAGSGHVPELVGAYIGRGDAVAGAQRRAAIEGSATEEPGQDAPDAAPLDEQPTREHRP